MKMLRPTDSVYNKLGVKIFGGQDKRQFLPNPCAFRKKALLTWNSPLLQDLLAGIEWEASETDIDESAARAMSAGLNSQIEKGFGLPENNALIALSILDAAPYSMVMEFMEQFHNLIQNRLSIEEKNNFNKVFLTTSRVGIMRALDAEECEIDLMTESGVVKNRAMRFRQPAKARLVRTQVWANFPALRKPLIAMVLEYLQKDGAVGNLVQVLVDWAEDDAGYAIDQILPPLIEKEDSPLAFAAARIVLDMLVANPVVSRPVQKMADTWWQNALEENKISRKMLLALSVSASRGDLNGIVLRETMRLLTDYAEEFFAERGFRKGAQLSFVLFTVLLIDKHEQLLYRFIAELKDMTGKGTDSRKSAMRLLTMALYADVLLISPDRPYMIFVRALSKDYLCYKDLTRLLAAARGMHETRAQQQMIMEEQLRFIDIFELSAAPMLIYYRRMALLGGGVNMPDILLELERMGEMRVNPCSVAADIRRAIAARGDGGKAIEEIREDGNQDEQ